MTASPGTEDHVAEHIPWEQLTITPPPDRRRLWYSVAAVMAVVVVALVVAPSLSGAPAAVPVDLVPSSATVSAAASATVAPAAVLPLAGPATPDVLSEADLLAIDGLGVDRALAARAEWIVLEFFTIDPADNWLERVQHASNVRIADDAAPATPAASTVSYVEWVRSTAVEPVRTGRYRVVVAMRRLVALDGVTYQRLPVEQVYVELRLGPDGVPELVVAPVIAAVDSPALAETVRMADRHTDSIGIGWPSSTSGDPATGGR